MCVVNLFGSTTKELDATLQGFGRAKHAVTTEKLKAQYPDYEVTWADEGY